MRVLIVKTSSMGDIIHALPALTDAKRARPELEFDWVVEHGFAEIPTWHPAVNRVIPIAFRRWRKHPLKTLLQGEWRAFKQQIQLERYDLIVDAQGLLKSAFIALQAKGPRAGLDFSSAREKWASLFYQQKHTVVFEQHAVTRVRQLFAKVFNYPLPVTTADYGLQRPVTNSPENKQPYVMLLHGTTWDTKHWPQASWQQLAKRLATAGYQVLVTWGNEKEKRNAEAIANCCVTAKVLPKQSLSQLASVLANAAAAVAVDTGLGHLAAALSVPTISLYGATDPTKTGTVGAGQVHLKSGLHCSPCLQKQCRLLTDSVRQPPCYADLSPTRVWGTLQHLLQQSETRQVETV